MYELRKWHQHVQKFVLNEKGKYGWFIEHELHHKLNKKYNKWKQKYMKQDTRWHYYSTPKISNEHQDRGLCATSLNAMYQIIYYGWWLH